MNMHARARIFVFIKIISDCTEIGIEMHLSKRNNNLKNKYFTYIYIYILCKKEKYSGLIQNVIMLYYNHSNTV